jgi:membrane-associated phospholipid phosphatase
MRGNTVTAMRGKTVGVLLGALLIAHLLDQFFYNYLIIEDIHSHDWGRALRVLGFAPVWLMVAIAIGLHDKPMRGTRRAWLLIASVAASGIAGELLKLLFRRERPNAHDGEYVFRSFAERPFSTGGLAFPSSHAIVAFGAAAMLARLFPRARVVFWSAAWGCGLSRVAAGAHFFSDIVMAAIAAWVIAWLIARKYYQDTDAPIPSV